MTPKPGVGIPTLIALGVLVIVGCAQPRPRQPTGGAPAYGPPRTCVVIYNVETLDGCKNLAVAGDAEAAMHVGNAYAGPFRQVVRPDPREAIDWYSRAADLGYLPAMRKLFNAYYFGRDVPKNDQRAEEYLLRAAGAGAQWAQLLIASRLEKSDPPKALDLYLALARADNCHAQARLAQAYYAGDLTVAERDAGLLLALISQSGRTHEEF
jgi:hypothetical protein